MQDADIAALCVGIYNYADQPPVTWDHFFDVTATQPVCCALKYVNDDTCLIFRGTDTPNDLLADLDAVPANSPFLGEVHSGFLRGLLPLATMLASLIRGKLYIGGHSLGAARATLAAGIFKSLGILPQKVVGLGPPRAGFNPLSHYVANIDFHLYRAVCPLAHPFTHDPICEVPPDWSGVGLGYQHVRPLTDVTVTVAEAAVKDMGAFAIHYSPGYAAALANLG